MDEFAPGMGFDVRAFQENGYAPVRYGSDASLMVKFYKKNVYKPPREELDPVTKQIKQIGTGREEEVVYCRIQAPGDKLSIWDAPAREEDKRRFWPHWQAFEKGAAHVGTPIQELAVGEDQEQKLRFYGIYTLEQLAAMSDGQLAAYGMGARELKDRALVRLNAKAKSAQDEEKAALKSELAEMREEMARLREQFSSEDAPKKRGRPAKSDVDPNA